MKVSACLARSCDHDVIYMAPRPPFHISLGDEFRANESLCDVMWKMFEQGLLATAARILTDADEGVGANV